MGLNKFSRFIIVLVAILLIPVTAFAWRFASLADSRGSDNGVNSEILTKIVNQIKSENVDLVIFEGDLVDARSDKDLGSKLDYWKSIMDKLGCPYYVSVGNHDIPGPGSENIVRAKFDLPANGPKGCEELVYSFDHKDAHFVSLDSHRYRDHNRVQRSWLRADLAGNKKPHVFVFSHDPAYPNGSHIGSSLDKYPDERDAFWRILASHGCQVYFCGHEHFYARSKKDGVIQVINGTCGAPIAKGRAGSILKYHYVIIDVVGNNVKAFAKDENGVQFDSWSYSIAN